MTYVLVPGAGGAGWYWHRVVAELQARGHEAIAVDLPADDEQAGLDAYADTNVAAATGADEPVVLVAQSMGGLSVPRVCARRPIARVVFVNAMIPAHGETGGAWWEVTRHAESRPPGAGVDVMEDFLHDVPEALHADAFAHDRDQTRRPFADVALDGDWPDVPTGVIASRDDRFFPLDFQRRVARERLGVEPVEVPGGHLVALVHPGELTDAIETATVMS